MNIKYKHKAKMTFIGFSTKIKKGEGYIKCPEFWNNEYTQKYARLWQTKNPQTPIEKAICKHGIGAFAICDDGDDSFDYWIVGLYNGGNVPEGLKLFSFPESDWAIFSTKGSLPDSIQNLNTYICQEWFLHEGKQYIADSHTMLEVYSTGDPQSPNYESAIWVPIIKPQSSDKGSEETIATATLLGIL